MGAEREPPDFVVGSELLETAFRYALGAHHGPARRGDTDIEHPITVARLLAEEGFEEDVVAAALLHDVVEDTSLAEDDILADFRSRVGALVSVMTEDESIDSYPDRKAEHRARVLRAGRVPAAIYLADKLARVRHYASRGEPVDPQRLEHYRATLREFAASRLDLPFIEALSEEMPALQPAGESGPAARS